MPGATIYNGAVVTYKTVWSFGVLAGSTNLASTMIAQVSQELVFDGLAITNYDAGNFNFFFDGNLPVTLQIANQSGAELDETDLNVQVADAVAQAGGTWVSGSVTDCTGCDGDGTNTGTGQSHATNSGIAQQAAAAAAAKPSSTVHQCGDPTWAWYSDLPQAISCMTSKLLGTLGILFIGLIVGVVLIVAAEEHSKM